MMARSVIKLASVQSDGFKVVIRLIDLSIHGNNESNTMFPFDISCHETDKFKLGLERTVETKPLDMKIYL